MDDEITRDPCCDAPGPARVWLLTPAVLGLGAVGLSLLVVSFLLRGTGTGQLLGMLSVQALALAALVPLLRVLQRWLEG